MFGRIFRITTGNPGEPGLELIKPELGIRNLIFEARIIKYPGVDINKMILSIYNLPKEHRRRIIVDRYNNLQVDFGYEDNGGALSTIFKGNVVRLQYEREDPETSVTKIYSYENGDFVQYGFYSGTLEQGTNIVDAIDAICNYVDEDDESGGQIIPYNIDSNIADITLPNDITMYSAKTEALQRVADACGVEYQLKNGGVYLTEKESDDAKINAVTFTKVIDNNKIVSTSGLVGIPTLTSEGLQFSCLINPLIDIYSYVKMDNSIISISQTSESDFQPEAEFGAQLDSNGIYKITGLEIQATNGRGQNIMKATALARNAYNE